MCINHGKKGKVLKMVIWPTHKVKTAVRKQKRNAVRKQNKRMNRIGKGKQNG